MLIQNHRLPRATFGGIPEFAALQSNQARQWVWRTRTAERISPDSIDEANVPPARKNGGVAA